MEDEAIEEALERLGYRDARAGVVKRYLAELVRRKRAAGGADAALTVSDIAMASLVFDGFGKMWKAK